MDPTTDPALRSWVPVVPPIRIFRFRIFLLAFSPAPETARVGVAIGEPILDLRSSKRRDISDIGMPRSAKCSPRMP